MSTILNSALAHGVLTNDLQVVLDALNQGADPNQVLNLNRYKTPEYHIIDKRRHQDPSSKDLQLMAVATEQHKNFKMALALWPKTKNKAYAHFTRAAFASGEDGLNFLKELKSMGVVLKDLKDSNGKTLLHYYFKSSNTRSYLRFYHTPTLKFLLDEGCDINAEDFQGNVPLHGCICFTDKDLNKKISLIIPSLELNKKNHNGDSLLKQMIFHVPFNMLLKIFKAKKTKLSLPEFGAFRMRLNYISKEKNLETILNLIKWDDYPLVKDLYPKLFERPYRREIIYNLASACQIGFLKEMEQTGLLKSKSMTDLVYGLTKTKSPRAVKVFKNYADLAFAKKQVSFSIFSAAFELSEIFMAEGNENSSEYLDLLENPNTLNNALLLFSLGKYEHRKSLLSVFSPTQVKSLLEATVFPNKSNEENNLFIDNFAFSVDYSYRSLFYDSINHFALYPQKLKKALEEQDFSTLNTIKKLHDFLSREAMRLQNALHELEQEKHCPALSLLPNKLLEYDLEIAKTNHELMDWGRSLGNCIGGGYYAQEALKGNCYLLGLKKDGEIAYTVEVRAGRILQFEGRSRSKNDDLRKALEKELLSKKIVKISS